MTSALDGTSPLKLFCSGDDLLLPAGTLTSSDSGEAPMTAPFSTLSHEIRHPLFCWDILHSLPCEYRALARHRHYVAVAVWKLLPTLGCRNSGISLSPHYEPLPFCLRQASGFEGTPPSFKLFWVTSLILPSENFHSFKAAVLVNMNIFNKVKLLPCCIEPLNEITRQSSFDQCLKWFGMNILGFFQGLANVESSEEQKLRMFGGRNLNKSQRFWIGCLQIFGVWS